MHGTFNSTKCLFDEYYYFFKLNFGNLQYDNNIIYNIFYLLRVKRFHGQILAFFWLIIELFFSIIFNLLSRLFFNNFQYLSWK